MTEDYSAFKGLDLNSARNKNETREEYKKRLKQNKLVMKIYNTVGRKQFKQMFPEGVNYKMFDPATKEKEINGEQN